MVACILLLDDGTGTDGSSGPSSGLASGPGEAIVTASAHDHPVGTLISRGNQHCTWWMCPQCMTSVCFDSKIGKPSWSVLQRPDGKVGGLVPPRPAAGPEVHARGHVPTEDSQFVGFGRYRKISRADLWEKDPGYCLWVLRQESPGPQLGQLAAYLATCTPAAHLRGAASSTSAAVQTNSESGDIGPSPGPGPWDLQMAITAIQGLAHLESSASSSSALTVDVPTFSVLMDSFLSGPDNLSQVHNFSVLLCTLLFAADSSEAQCRRRQRGPCPS